MKSFFSCSLFALLVITSLSAQDWIRTGTGLGVEKIRLAAPDFKTVTTDGGTQNLAMTFNVTFSNDLQNAGIFDMVSRSFFPLSIPGAPQEVRLNEWGSAPPNASMLAFGNLGVSGGFFNVQGWLYDTKNPQSPQVLGKQYREQATDENARVIAHRFADEIIFRLGGGVPGIAESHVYFVSSRSGSKEIWQMDYDGANQKQLTHLGSIALSPHVSPDGSRVAFSGVTKQGWQILMYSKDLSRLVSFPYFGGDNYSPAWSSDGQNIAFSSSKSGNTEIYSVSSTGGSSRQLTQSKGPDVSPTWNPKTNAQIAWVSGRTGLPQIYTMASDGTNLARVTDQGYAVSPSWSPNGQFLAFAWVRHYGPGAPGASDIYIMDVASKQWAQLTHDGGRNDFPSWSPDGRHIVFQSNRTGKTQIWTMLADGSEARQLTTSGENSQPNWSFK
ncbi:MAG TPA: Tol-Pal system beta propeller repeat protein TolB [Terriglobales bacterium]|nr:Tol-Pal system beta propeller repeat protein TolB [Terriglobales bacterium]